MSTNILESESKNPGSSNYQSDEKEMPSSSSEEKASSLFDSAECKFPFTQVKLNLKTLKELQIPVSTKPNEI